MLYIKVKIKKMDTSDANGRQTQGYHQNNKYFGKHIDKFFETTKLNKSSFESKVDFYDVDYFKPHCRDCKIVSQLEDINCLGNKRLQYLSMKHHFNGKLPKFVPFTLPFKSSEAIEIKNLFDNNKTYILKPENALSRRGISIVSTFEEANTWISSHPNFKIWIIQEFIANTLTYERKKFHLRIYAIYMMNEKKIRTYVYANGFIYQAKDEYDVRKMTDDKIGLSGENSKEQVKIFPDDFVETFGIDNYKHVANQIDIVIRDTITACSSILKCPNKQVKDYQCFKLFGYDLLVDDAYKVWLLEINARFISFKYPPSNYLNNMYSDILNLIFKNITTNFRKVLDIKREKKEKTQIISTKIIEGFTQLKNVCGCGLISSKILWFLFIIFLIIWIILIIFFVCALIKNKKLASKIMKKISKLKK
jgi:hypothetical protein